MELAVPTWVRTERTWARDLALWNELKQRVVFELRIKIKNQAEEHQENQISDM